MGGEIEKQPPRLLIYPNSRLSSFWSVLLYFSLSYDVMLLPVKLVFVGNQIDATLMALDVLVDLLLLLDTFLQFRLAFTVDGRLITDLREIRRRYLYSSKSRASSHQMQSNGRIEFSCKALLRRGAFLPTLVSSFPASLLCMLSLAGADARALQTCRLIRCVRLVPMLRADAITRQQPSGLDELLRLMRRSPYDLMYTAHKLLPLLSAYLVLSHYVACGYWAVVLVVVPPHESDYGVLYMPASVSGDKGAELSFALAAGNATLDPTGSFYLPWANLQRISEILQDSEWLPTAPYLQEGSVLLWYLRSLYFAVCNLTGLGKSPLPFRNICLVYTTFTFIVGVLVFAYITSSIVTVRQSRASTAHEHWKWNPNDSTVERLQLSDPSTLLTSMPPYMVCAARDERERSAGGIPSKEACAAWLYGHRARRPAARDAREQVDGAL